MTTSIDIIFVMTKELKKVDDTLDPEIISNKIEQGKIQLQEYIQDKDQKAEAIKSKKNLINNTQSKIDSVDEDKLLNWWKRKSIKRYLKLKKDNKLQSDALWYKNITKKEIKKYLSSSGINI